MKQRHPHLPTRRLALVCVALACAALLAYAGAAHTGAEASPFALAAEFPRGALVYAQCDDLPALVKQWDESALKQRYLVSVNFRQFQQHHLALKIAARWQEFNDALGFSLDAAALVSATDRRAAVAVYDIGRLDLLFVAPLNAARFAAASFVAARDDFEEVKLPGGDIYYRREVAADRGRQKQELVFAHRGGRFLLATSEPLLLRALAQGNKQHVPTDRLAAEPSFAALARVVTPHLVTVWVDQARLNRDYYFKHYWLTGDAATRTDIRAGMFDLEQRDDVWRERREFLLDDAHRASLDAPTLPAQEAQRLAALAPADAPYCRVRALGGSDHSTPEHDAALSLRDALLDEAPTADAGRGTAPGWPGTSSDEIYEANGGEGAWDDEHREYAYLNADYDAAVNDAHDAGLSDDAMDEGRLRMGADAAALSELQKVLRLAAPLGVVAIARTQSHPAPLFTDFDHAAIITFAAPARLDHTRLEAALAGLVRRRLMLAGIDGATGAGWQWADATDAAGVGIVRRELVVPVVNWRIGYALTGRDLIVADDADLLREVAARAQTAGASASTTTAASTVNQHQFATLDELTLVDFTHQARDFRQTMLRLDAPLIKAKREKHERNEAGQPAVAAAADSEEFFSGNVASLLDAARVRAVRLTRRRPAPGRLHEELEYVLLPGVPTE